MEGTHEVINLIAAQNIPIAIASSSAMDVIYAVLEKVLIRDKIKIICSAEHEQYGKPHPGVYITTAEKLGIDPSQCLTFEDSPNGVLSAKAAKMKCVAVPDRTMIDDRRFCIADLIIYSLKDFTIKHLNNLET
jgi:sugar-phosphatase